MTAAEQLASAVLATHASAYHVAGTPLQRERVIQTAALSLAPLLAQLVRAEAHLLAVNPT